MKVCDRCRKPDVDCESDSPVQMYLVEVSRPAVRGMERLVELDLCSDCGDVVMDAVDGMLRIMAKKGFSA